ncbi:MAG TPA: glycosyltransferase family 4 protein [Thermomicrobiales bacterium]|nr:glycosyltransferase family 4 protein [Thermomicrobiales bacterium]
MSGTEARARPIRVALLHNIVSPHVVPLFAELARQPGIDLCVYFFSETDANRRWRVSPEGRFRYRILPGLGVRFRGRDLFTYFINPTIVPLLLRDGLDVLIAVGWDSFASQAAFFLCKLLGRPFIIWSGSTINEPSWRRTLSLPLVRLMVGGADACIAYGTRAAAYLRRLGAPPAGVFVSLNTIDMDTFMTRVQRARSQRDVVRRELGVGDDPLVLYVGQLIERKGVATLIEAMALARGRGERVRLCVIGYGAQEEALRRQVERLRLTEHVRFVGHVDLNDLPRYYAAADLFVLPSSEEVWGLVLNEAVAAGLPVITTDRVGAAPDIVEDGGNGLVVPADAAGWLADAITYVLDDPARTRRMGERSLEIAARFRVGRTVCGVLDAIEHVGARTGA